MDWALVVINNPKMFGQIACLCKFGDLKNSSTHALASQSGAKTRLFQKLLLPRKGTGSQRVEGLPKLEPER